MEIFKKLEVFLCVHVSFFFFSFFATFDFTLLINKMLYLKHKSPILLKIQMHFGKLLFKINAKFQRISNSHL